MMPRLDGLGLLQQMRADPALRDVPVLLLSARAGEEARIEGLHAGADDYVVKPFSARELLARVESHLKMARLRREANEAIAESEKRFRHMANHAPVMIMVTGPDGACSFANETWSQFTGQDGEGPLGLGWLDAVHPDDRAAVRRALISAHARAEPFRLEYRLLGSDGDYRWALEVAAPRVDEDGRFLGYIGSVIDLTERKQAEQTQQLLFAELNHRVKNTLASVQAIAQHTLRSSKTPADFTDSFSGRIQSLARVHTLLSSTAWQGADLGELIRDQLLSGAAEETRITARGPAVHLDPQMTLHCALLLHELGTNAAKYGALSAAKGWIAITWSVRDSVLHLRWAERDGPPVSAPTRRGFGSTLIDQSVRSQGGRAEVSYAIDGVTWDLTLRLPDPADRPRAPGVMTGPPRDEQGDRHFERGPAARLAGRRFLVVEDEPLVALDLTAGLEAAGAHFVAQVGTPEDALRLIATQTFDAVVLDGNLHGHSVEGIAVALTERNIPFIFVTGYGRESLPRAFRSGPIVAKPFTQEQLVDAAANLFGRSADVVPLKA
jgi:PAS domain S-box-containing protein